MSRLKFQVLQECKDSSARMARLTTLHGEVRTPIFMPVGTQATVKGLTVESLKQAGSRVLLANTYHLLLRPGVEVFRKFGGIHKFMNWDGPVLTDSGGFQIFSLENSRKISEQGAEFKSYVDGVKYLLSPEKSISTQIAIGSDIMMVLDQCVPSTSEHKVAESAMHLTHRWARRSLEARGDSPQSLFAIVQGACFADLRKQSVEQLCVMNFDGFAIGGLAVGESKNQRDDFTELTAGLLSKNLPRYLMGVGTPLDILDAVHRGVDMFDCIMPSSIAKRGTAFTSKGKVHIYRGVYKFSEDSLDPACRCLTCTNFSRAYLHHLIKSDELLGWKLLSKHNLYFYHQMMADIQNHIRNGSFLDYSRERRSTWSEGDQENPMNPPKVNRVRRTDSSKVQI
jgi:queuine tRNA-ribosyltransferase